jgi:hypothetical protein
MPPLRQFLETVTAASEVRSNPAAIYIARISNVPYIRLVSLSWRYCDGYKK